MFLPCIAGVQLVSWGNSMRQGTQKQHHRLREGRIYLDYAASCPLDPKVAEVMGDAWRRYFGNPGAEHHEGRAAREQMEAAREVLARHLRAHPEEITFVSGGTEANNMGVIGVLRALSRAQQRPLSAYHCITTAVEHASVLECFRALEQEGVAVTYLAVDAEGNIDLASLRRALRPETALVSVMQVNSEIGTCYPLREIARTLRAHRKKHRCATPYFHTDASQGPAVCAVDCTTLGVDLMTVDAQKIYGPKGVGALFHRRGVPVAPLIIGGAQEEGLRGGTPAVPLIMGLAAAIEAVAHRCEEEAARLSELRAWLIAALESRIPVARLNGPREGGAPHIVNFSFLGWDAQELVLRMDARGIALSTKSVCRGREKTSHVIAALGKDAAHLASAVRFSLGYGTTKGDLERVVAALEALCASPEGTLL